MSSPLPPCDDLIRVLESRCQRMRSALEASVHNQQQLAEKYNLLVANHQLEIEEAKSLQNVTFQRLRLLISLLKDYDMDLYFVAEKFIVSREDDPRYIPKKEDMVGYLRALRRQRSKQQQGSPVDTGGTASPRKVGGTTSSPTMAPSSPGTSSTRNVQHAVKESLGAGRGTTGTCARGAISSCSGEGGGDEKALLYGKPSSLPQSNPASPLTTNDSEAESEGKKEDTPSPSNSGGFSPAAAMKGRSEVVPSETEVEVGIAPENATTMVAATTEEQPNSSNTDTSAALVNPLLPLSEDAKLEEEEDAPSSPYPLGHHQQGRVAVAVPTVDGANTPKAELSSNSSVASSSCWDEQSRVERGVMRSLLAVDRQQQQQEQPQEEIEEDDSESCQQCAAKKKKLFVSQGTNTDRSASSSPSVTVGLSGRTDTTPTWKPLRNGVDAGSSLTSSPQRRTRTSSSNGHKHVHIQRTWDEQDGESEHEPASPFAEQEEAKEGGEGKGESEDDGDEKTLVISTRERETGIPRALRIAEEEELQRQRRLQAKQAAMAAAEAARRRGARPSIFFLSFSQKIKNILAELHCGSFLPVGGTVTTETINAMKERVEAIANDTRSLEAESSSTREELLASRRREEYLQNELRRLVLNGLRRSLPPEVAAAASGTSPFGTALGLVCPSCGAAAPKKGFAGPVYYGGDFQQQPPTCTSSNKGQPAKDEGEKGRQLPTTDGDELPAHYSSASSPFFSYASHPSIVNGRYLPSELSRGLFVQGSNNNNNHSSGTKCTTGAPLVGGSLFSPLTTERQQQTVAPTKCSTRPQQAPPPSSSGRKAAPLPLGSVNDELPSTSSVPGPSVPLHLPRMPTPARTLKGRPLTVPTVRPQQQPSPPVSTSAVCAPLPSNKPSTAQQKIRPGAGAAGRGPGGGGGGGRPVLNLDTAISGEGGIGEEERGKKPLSAVVGGDADVTLMVTRREKPPGPSAPSPISSISSKPIQSIVEALAATTEEVHYSIDPTTTTSTMAPSVPYSGSRCSNKLTSSGGSGGDNCHLALAVVRVLAAFSTDVAKLLRVARQQSELLADIHRRFLSYTAFMPKPRDCGDSPMSSENVLRLLGYGPPPPAPPSTSGAAAPGSLPLPHPSTAGGCGEGGSLQFALDALLSPIQQNVTPTFKDVCRRQLRAGAGDGDHSTGGVGVGGHGALLEGYELMTMLWEGLVGNLQQSLSHFRQQIALELIHVSS